MIEGCPKARGKGKAHAATQQPAPPSSDVGKKVPRRSISCLLCWEGRRRKRARPRVWREGTDPESELSLPPYAAAKQGPFSIGGMSPALCYVVLGSTLPFRCGVVRVHGRRGGGGRVQISDHSGSDLAAVDVLSTSCVIEVRIKGWKYGLFLEAVLM